MGSVVAKEKLQKVLAREGVASRRVLETWIEAGRIKVNDHIAQLGERIDASDAVWIDGKRIEFSVNIVPEFLLYHKPRGEICARQDPENRPLIFRNLPFPKSGRWVNIGRLDINTSGLLLLTNQGEFAHCLMHPSYQIEREYWVRVFGEVTSSHLKQLVEGVEVEGELLAFASVTPVGGHGANRWYRVVLNEGRYREVRRLWEALGVKVTRLIRTRYGNIVLPKELKPGEFVYLSPAEIQGLLDLIKTKPNVG